MKSGVRWVAIGLLASVTMVSGGVQAQDNECPPEFSCVGYQGYVIEVDPALGPFQAIVVEDRTTTIRDLDGESIERTVMVIGLAQEEGKYTIHHAWTVDRSGPFAQADVGDVFILSEVGG